MGFERNYPLRIPSNQFIKLLCYSTINVKQLSHFGVFNPYFITGFCDAEASFQIVIIKNKNSKLG